MHYAFISLYPLYILPNPKPDPNPNPNPNFPNPNPNPNPNPLLTLTPTLTLTLTLTQAWDTLFWAFRSRCGGQWMLKNNVTSPTRNPVRPCFTKQILVYQQCICCVCLTAFESCSPFLLLFFDSCTVEPHTDILPGCVCHISFMAVPRTHEGHVT